MARANAWHNAIGVQQRRESVIARRRHHPPWGTHPHSHVHRATTIPSTTNNLPHAPPPQHTTVLHSAGCGNTTTAAVAATNNAVDWCRPVHSKQDADRSIRVNDHRQYHYHRHHRHPQPSADANAPPSCARSSGTRSQRRCTGPCSSTSPRRSASLRGTTTEHAWPRSRIDRTTSRTPGGEAPNTHA